MAKSCVISATTTFTTCLKMAVSPLIPLSFNKPTTFTSMSCVEYWPTLIRSETVRVVCAWSDCCLIVLLGTEWVTACLNGWGSVMLVIVSGSEFQLVLFWGNRRMYNSSCWCGCYGVAVTDTVGADEGFRLARINNR